MGLKDSWNNPAKNARMEMEDAERKAKKNFPSDNEKVDESGKSVKSPNRYRLYDKIKVSVRTMDMIIYVVIGLLVFCLVIGIATGQS